METVTLDSWEAFRQSVRATPAEHPVYWRGHSRPGLPLASTFERRILDMQGGRRPGASLVYPYGNRYGRDGHPQWEPGFYHRFRDRWLQLFMQAASGMRGPNPAPLEEEQWWALGRHFGLVTPLLDWTEKPYIAAFFALSGFRVRRDRDPVDTTGPAGETVEVYRLLHTPHLESDELRVVRPIIEELGRLHGQKGLFTWLDSERYFELQGLLDDTGRGHLLTRMVLTGDALGEGLQDLDAHGVDYRTLYPDLLGAALHANAQMDWRATD